MILTLDTETTTWSKGSPFDERNFLVCISYFTDRSYVRFTGDWAEVADLIKSAELVVGFNIKFDLHWLRKEFGIVPARIWDCQLAEFLLGRQTPSYPDLDSCALKYTGQGKSRVIEEYWDKGIQTHEIPRHVVAERCALDVELTHKVYLAQRELIPAHQQRLLSLQNQDLLVLQEMEWNGVAIDEKLSEEKAQEVEAEISRIQTELDLYHNVPGFNWASVDHLSALLYGGTIKKVERVPNGFFKSGAKVGHVKFKKVEREYKLPRLFKPLRNSELKKEGLYSVDEGFLRKLKGNDDLIKGILKLKGLEKLVNTYLRGFPDRRRESHWPEGRIHPTFNQCVVISGRLSSTKPNVQNIPFDEVGQVFISRYD